MYCKYYCWSILLLLCNISCIGQNKKQVLNNNNMIEKIDFDFLEKYAEKRELFPSKVIHYDFREIQDDGTEVYVGGNANIGFLDVRTPPRPAYWIEYKKYYPTGIIKEKGKKIEGKEQKIGIWLYYDDSGNLIGEEDCDKKYGAFSYEQVLGFLVEKKHLGENYEGVKNVRFFYNEKDHQWEISVHSEIIMYEYSIDGNSGEVLSRKSIEMVE